MIHSVIQYLQSIPHETWQQLFHYLEGAGVVTVVLQFVKNKLHIDSKHVITVLLGIFSALASIAIFLITNVPGAPIPEVANIWPYVITGAVFLHRFAVSPTWHSLQARLERFSGKVEDYQTETHVDPTPKPPQIFTE